MPSILRDKTIETTTANLIRAGVLLPPKVARYMACIGGLTDNELAIELVNSKYLLDGYYHKWAEAVRN